MGATSPLRVESSGKIADTDPQVLEEVECVQKAVRSAAGREKGGIR
jgi:hypothetical protein